MLRTPRCRLSAIKFLDRRIPKSIQLAGKAVRENRIFLSPYNYEIKTGKVNLADLNDPNPDWHSLEMTHLTRLAEESIESYFFFYYPCKETLVTNALLSGLSIVQ